MKKGFVYILEDETGKYYLGSTVDVLGRFKKHLQGHTATTSRMHNLKLKFAQEYPTLADARRIERKLKKLKRKDYIDKIIKDGFIKIN